MPERRIDMNRAVRALFDDVAARMPEFSHVLADRVLVVAGEARRASRSTIRPLTFEGGKSASEGRRKPVVRLRRRKIFYCVTLRPLFFRASTPEMRVGTLLHELFHASPRFDGTLDESRRHARSGSDFHRRLRPLVRRYLRQCPKEVLAPFAHDGEVRILQWLERPAIFYVPGRGTVRRNYTEAHLFPATVRMITPGVPRTSARIH